MGYYRVDITYILVIIGAIFSLLASAGVKTTYNKYKRVASQTGMTGEQAARRILDMQGMPNVRVEHISGELTDHYDPSANVVRLSDATYNSASVAAVGVAAHECGHAKQHAEGYLPVQLRSALVPVANLGSKLGIPIFIIGMFMASAEALGGLSSFVITLGIWVFGLSVLFHIVTLPVEFDASRRGLRFLVDTGVLSNEEAAGSRKVLRAAAMTYVASAAASVLYLLRLILLSKGGRRRR